MDSSVKTRSRSPDLLDRRCRVEPFRVQQRLDHHLALTRQLALLLMSQGLRLWMLVGIELARVSANVSRQSRADEICQRLFSLTEWSLARVCCRLF